MKLSGVDHVIKTDVVIVGSGIAGMTAALGLSPLSVALVTKKTIGDGSSSRLAQGGVAVALGEDDSPGLHAGDTLAVGYELSDSDTVDIVTQGGPELIQQLIQLGAKFDRNNEGRIQLGREAAHSRRRIVHANGDSTGAEIVRTLVEAVRQSSRIHLEEDCFAAEILLESGSPKPIDMVSGEGWLSGRRISGVLARRGDGTWVLFRAGAIILATGGIGSLFTHSTNPMEATGDGLAMAARAGAQLVDLEFMQFHPTALACEASPLPLLTEALRGEGAVLIDSEGDRFMLAEHELAELAPRDVVSRAIWRKRQSGSEVYLDARKAVGDRFPERFPTVYEACRQHGIDPRIEPMPATPAAHYHIGGIVTDRVGRTSLPGLWACGEVASTGLHGANRLASNSLLEALVFGQRVARDIQSSWHPRNLLTRSADPGTLYSSVRERDDLKMEIRRLMWANVGLVRDAGKLEAALNELGRIERELGPAPSEVRNMVTVGKLVTQAALIRRESRGVHYRSDFPESLSEWRRRLYFSDAQLVPEKSLSLAK
ncbi:MAG: L-aspartate oxidase [Acidobacteriota bacterium]|nr:MAG: L-aspartate oxidase [Acidobacteriota bacterium]